MSAVVASRRFWGCWLSLTGIVLLTEGVALVRAQRTADRAVSRWEAKLRERSEYEALNPAPTKESAIRLEANLSSARAALAQSAERLGVAREEGTPDEAKGTPASSTDAFFEIATFVARLRQEAEGKGITLNAGERFGFSAYTEEPPAAELAALVLRQRRFAEVVLRMLFEARPERLLSFQRESLSRVPADRAGTPGARMATSVLNPSTQDYFTIDPLRSLRRPGVIESTAFRVVFTGATQTLRSFVNALATDPLPLVIRSVEVERIGSETGSRALPRLDRSTSVTLDGDASADHFAGPTPLPVIIPARSKCTVIVEVVHFVGKVPDAE